MSERYPDDATLLALTEDSSTGVEYISTGRSPYVLEFRKLVERILRVSAAANDFRVYQDGDLTIGVRAGKCFINNASVAYSGTMGVSVASNTTTHVWLDDVGVLQTGNSGLPADRTTILPLAEIATGSSTISTINDLRGEVFLQIPNLSLFGVTATSNEINQVLAGINPTVDVTALGVLTNGPESTADGEHRHLQVFQNEDSNAFFTLLNDSNDSNANIGLVLSLPNKLADSTTLQPNLTNGFLSQSFNGVTYNLVGIVNSAYAHEGDLTSSQSNKLLGMVPISGTVNDVILSVGTNIQSSNTSDSLTATIKVNGSSVASVDPEVAASDGSGFRSTSQGDGIVAVIKTDGTENVSRGNLFSVDITRTVAGTVTTEAADIVVMVVIRADQPE